MFLVAITMLLFGMEMHVMFVGSSGLAGKLSRFLHLSTSTKVKLTYHDTKQNKRTNLMQAARCICGRVYGFWYVDDCWFLVDQAVPSRVGIHTIMQAKSKIGQAVIMMLQVGVLEKFKTIPLVTGFDLACFAGAVFTSSACMLLLSKLAGSGSGALKR